MNTVKEQSEINFNMLRYSVVFLFSLLKATVTVVYFFVCHALCLQCVMLFVFPFVCAICYTAPKGLALLLVGIMAIVLLLWLVVLLLSFLSIVRQQEGKGEGHRAVFLLFGCVNTVEAICYAVSCADQFSFIKLLGLCLSAFFVYWSIGTWKRLKNTD